MSTQVGLNVKGKSGLPSRGHGRAPLQDSSKVTIVTIISMSLAFTFSGV
jgi:hypothetical protein